MHGLTAFGGPQGHYAMYLKTFVRQRKDITEAELLEYNAFCQLLPGASSTQVCMLIGYKRGGVSLAVLSLLVWIFPATVIMGAFSFLLHHIGNKESETAIFRFIQPMAVGFLAYASLISFKQAIINPVTRIIFVIAGIATYLFFKTPWIFPALILLGGFITNLSDRRIPQVEIIKRKIKWGNAWLFVLVFLIAGALSEVSRKNNWETRQPLNLFENMYRYGSMVFGGGQVLIPMLFEQYVERPTAPGVLRKSEEKGVSVIEIDRDDFYTGAGVVRAVPGPVFSFASFIGGMAMKDRGPSWQLLGIVVATTAIFLPTALLVLFFYPIWNNLKKYAVVYRSLEGINAAVVGIMAASTVYMMNDIAIIGIKTIHILNISVIISTFLILIYTKIPAPLIVFVCLLLGWLFP